VFSVGGVLYDCLNLVNVNTDSARVRYFTAYSVLILD